MKQHHNNSPANKPLPKPKRKSSPHREIVHISSFEKGSEPSQSALAWNIRDLFDLLEEYLRSPSFASLLSARQTIALGQVCRSFRRIFNLRFLRLVVRMGNLEPELRCLFWIRQAPYINTERQCRASLSLDSVFDSAYSKLLLRGMYSPQFDHVRTEIKQYHSVSHQKCCSDIRRTYEDPQFMCRETLEKMENVLTALAVLYSDVGYCQGMGFVVGALISILGEEELAFWMFSGLAEKHHLRLLFMKGLPAIHLHIHILEDLLEMYLPRMDAHLRKLGVGWDMFTTKFALTLGAAYFPLESLGEVYDVFFMDGWVGLYRIEVAYLESHQAAICSMDMAALSEYLKSIRQITKQQGGVKGVLRRAVEIHIQQDAIEKSIDGFFRIQAGRYLKPVWSSCS